MLFLAIATPLLVAVVWVSVLALILIPWAIGILLRDRRERGLEQDLLRIAIAVRLIDNSPPPRGFLATVATNRRVQIGAGLLVVAYVLLSAGAVR